MSPTTLSPSPNTSTVWVLVKISTLGRLLAFSCKTVSAFKASMNSKTVTLENRRIEKVEVAEGMKVLSVKGGETYKAPVLIIATGANWRKLNVPGEEKYIGHGVAFCPHCDGPFSLSSDFLKYQYDIPPNVFSDPGPTVYR